MTRRPYSPRMPVADRREQLLDAALRIIDRDGFGGVSIDRIAREADVTRPVVYRAFADLDELLRTLLDRQERRALRRLAVVDPTDPESVRALIDTVRAEPQTWRPILFADQSPPAVRERVERDRALVRERLGALIAGVVPPGVDPDVMAHAMVAVAEHFGRLVIQDPDYDVESLLTTMRALLPGTP